MRKVRESLGAVKAASTLRGDTLAVMRRRALIAAALALASTPAFAAGKTEKKKGGGATYIQIKPISATVMRPGGRRGILTVECGLDIPDERLRAVAEVSQPRLRAAFGQLIRTYAAGLRLGSAPDADYLAREMQRETDAILGRKGARLLVGTMLIN